MNRSFIGKLALALGVAVGMGAFASRVGSSPSVLYGDVTGDGAVSLEDASLALDIALGLEKPTAQEFESADVAPFPGVGGRAIGDGNIDLADVRQILMYSIGVIQEDQFRPALNPGDKVSYRQDVLPILQNAGCESWLCHGGRIPKGEMTLQPGDEYLALVEAPSSEADGYLRVKPGDPDHSYLMAKLLGTPESLGGSGARMPAGEALIPPPLPDDQINRIREWIAEGAPDN